MPYVLRRRAARVVLLDREDRILLMRASDPVEPEMGFWWEIPGGGMERRESSGDAARRELYEETGIEAVEMGPCVWRQHVTFTFAGYDFDQHEWIHVARCDGGEYRPAGLEALEAQAFDSARWWPLDELHLFGGDGHRLIPPWLPERLPAVLAEGFPAEPIDLGDV